MAGRGVASCCHEHPDTPRTVLRLWTRKASAPLKTLHNIVVGLDLTPASRGALAQSLRIAARNDATLYALHAIEFSVVDELLAFVGLGRDLSLDAIRSRA